MGLGSGDSFNPPEPQVFQDGLDDLPVFNEGEDAHASPALQASQGIDRFRGGATRNMPFSSVRYQDMAVGIEAEKVAKGLDGDDGAGDGIPLRHRLLKKELKGGRSIMPN